MSPHCAVMGCGNGSYRLERWKAAHCDIHQVRHDSNQCSCPLPFSFHPLPTRKKKSEERTKWLRLINRIDTAAPGKQKLWSPSKYARVCSKHFKDGQPTEENPYPTEDLGYPGFHEKVARILSSVPIPGPSSRKRARRKIALNEPPHLPPTEQAAGLPMASRSTCSTTSNSMCQAATTPLTRVTCTLTSSVVSAIGSPALLVTHVGGPYAEREHQRGSKIIWLVPVRKPTPVPVDLSQLSPVQGSGQECRQPVLQSSGPASGESLGPQPPLSACGPYPVMLIGPREKELLFQKHSLSAKSSVEETHQSSIQQDFSEDLAVTPVVKKEPCEGDCSAQSYSEQGITHATQEHAALPPVEVKVEPAEDSISTHWFQEHEVTKGCAAVPTEVKMEAGDFAASFVEERRVHEAQEQLTKLPVEVKMEPIEDYSNECFKERERGVSDQMGLQCTQ